jgi:hypothetical protein
MTDNLENRIGVYNKQKKLFSELDVKVTFSRFFNQKELHISNLEGTRILPSEKYISV